jgi:predicted oxidoreductase
VKSISLGTGTAPSVALGLMRIDGMPDDAVRTLGGAAREVGIDLLDHADI